MDEAQDIFDYLPQFYKTPGEGDYIAFLWDAFSVNYQAGKYQFAYIAYHMLFMCFIYFQLAKIYQHRPDDIKNIMMFTDKAMAQVEKHERVANLPNTPVQHFNPFSLSSENERTIMGLFISVGCDRETIKKMKGLVNTRNDVAHSNGNIFFQTQENVDAKIEEILECADCIQGNLEPIVGACFEKFLLDSANLEANQYPDAADQVREILVRGNYLSAKDVAIARTFDITRWQTEDYYPNIEKLAMALQEMYPEEA